MLTGLMSQTSGTAYVENMELGLQMTDIYKLMGVCPQHDLLWPTLTAAEHLNFYGRLKKLVGAELKAAVDEGLAAVNLLNVANKRVGEFSGGMKRRLSVAISLMGKPKVVYMDEPSTGLDPASRKALWKVIKAAKKNTCMILTTHSMEEAGELCDRLGIFVGGKMQCVGSPRELIRRISDSEHTGSCGNDGFRFEFYEKSRKRGEKDVRTGWAEQVGNSFERGELERDVFCHRGCEVDS